MQKKILHLLLLIFIVGLGLLCVFHLSDADTEATDYSDHDNWLAIPDSADIDVDIFYLYPTAYHKQEESDLNICEIGNRLVRSNAQLSYRLQATAFDTVGNIYAPYYRQGDVETCLSMPEDGRDKLLSGAPEKTSLPHLTIT